MKYLSILRMLQSDVIDGDITKSEGTKSGRYKIRALQNPDAKKSEHYKIQRRRNPDNGKNPDYIRTKERLSSF